MKELSSLPSPARDSLSAAVLVAGLVALGGVAVWSLGAPAPVHAAAKTQPAKTDDIALVASTPQVALPQPVFDAENDMSLPDRLARWDRLIDEGAKRFGVPRDWIIAVMRQESGGRTVL